MSVLTRWCYCEGVVGLHAKAVSSVTLYCEMLARWQGEGRNCICGWLLARCELCSHTCMLPLFVAKRLIGVVSELQLCRAISGRDLFRCGWMSVRDKARMTA